MAEWVKIAESSFMIELENIGRVVLTFDEHTAFFMAPKLGLSETLWKSSYLQPFNLQKVMYSALHSVHCHCMSMARLAEDAMDKNKWQPRD